MLIALDKPPGRRMVARHMGATTVRISGLAEYSDTASVEVPPPTTLSRTVIVRGPVARVVIHPRPDTIHVGDATRFVADAFDDLGGLLQHAPVELSYPDRAPNPKPRWPGDEWIDLPPGAGRRVVASFRGFADTITVFVADTAKR